MAIKYIKIYEDLKKRIENEEYRYQMLIPSESILIKKYDCSRNTVRRAIAQLAQEGYVVSVNGRGVVVIYKQNLQAKFAIGGQMTYSQISAANKSKYHTQVICFAEMIVDEKISRKTTFPLGKKFYYIQRIRRIQEEAYIIDHNYFLKDIVKGLNSEIASKSIYEYMYKELNETISSTRRMLTIESPSDTDKEYMDLGNYNCVAVVSSYSFNADGIMFEFTQSHHKPDGFVFYEQSNSNPVSYFM